MAIHLPDWMHFRKEKPHEIGLEDVEPLHPDQYPAKHLKEMLDHRRADLADIMAHPTGIPEGPGSST